MNVDDKVLVRVAEVSRLSLTKEEFDSFLPELTDVLANFRKIHEVDTTGIKPSVHPIKIDNALREDVPGKTLSVNEALSLTKHKKNNYFKCPKTVK